jgi:malonyl-CoA/methylmalonyl-CoA synthetase
MAGGPELFTRALRHGGRTAIFSDGGSFTYDELLAASGWTASALLDRANDLKEARVAYLVPPGFEYAAAQWGVWRAGGIAVPLGVMHPPAEWEYLLDDTRAATVIAHPEFRERIEPLCRSRSIRLLDTDEVLSAGGKSLPVVDPSRRALILYTSGTTSRPKGVVTTHACIAAQVESLVEAWEWSEDDRILHVLPLHHIHGIINILSCALWSGAKCEFMPFDADAVLDRFTAGGLTLFMAVPTVYAKLITAWKQADPERQQKISEGCRAMRLMVSGSAALPVTTLEAWREISGHVLLERYGMTEIGMGLSNPLCGERVPGHVGRPLPRVEVRRTDEGGRVLEADDVPGEIEVRGPTVFREYWDRPEATAGAFRDGWFRTGDVAVVEAGSYRILGRQSVDIIKTGGYKVSALEIEEVLRTHPAVRECAVVGVPDDEWGERVAACIVPAEEDQSLTLPELREWGRDRLAAYKLPTLLHTTDELPRNAMGKVQKPAVAALFMDVGERGRDEAVRR